MSLCQVGLMQMYTRSSGCVHADIIGRDGTITVCVFSHDMIVVAIFMVACICELFIEIGKGCNVYSVYVFAGYNGTNIKRPSGVIYASKVL